MCQEVEGDDDPENKDDASDKDENDQGTKVEHHRSSVKMRSMVDQNFLLQSKVLMLVVQGLFCSVSHKRTLLSRHAILRGSVEGNIACLVMS